MKKPLLLLITTLMTLPLVTAGMSNVELTMNGAPNDRVRPSIGQDTNIRFLYEPEPDNNVSSFTAELNAENLTEGAAPQYDAIQVDLSDNDHCPFTDGVYNCTVTHQRLNANSNIDLEIEQSQDTTIPLSLTVQTDTGPVTHHAETSVTVDDQPPKPTYVGPTRCQDEDTCYVNEEPLNYTARFESGTGTFHQQKVVALAEEQGTTTPIRFAQPGACQDATCTTTKTITCSDENTITYTLNTGGNNPPPTQDDAGNIVENNTETQATCDTKPPVINNVSVSGSTQGLPTVESGAEITVEGSESSQKPPEIHVEYNDTVQTGTCSNQGDSRYECTAQPPAVSSQGTKDLDITVTDAAGNEANRTLTVNYLSTIDEESDIWRSPDTTFLSSPVNKDILQAEPKVYSKASFDATGGEAQLHDVALQGCTASDSALKSVEVDHVVSADNKAYFTYTLRQPGEYNETIDTNRLTTNCTLQVTGRTDEFIYTQGEPENMTLTVPLQSGTRLSNKLRGEIADTREDIQDYKGAWTKLGKGIEIAQKACRTGSILEALFSKYSVSGKALSSTPATKAAAENMKTPEEIAREKASGAWRKKLGKFCEIMTCQTDRQKSNVDLLNQENEKIIDSVDWIDAQGGNWEGELQGYSGQRFEQTYNPYNSFAAAVVGMCPPAIRKHTRSYMQTECNYLSCLAQSQERTGFSVERCRAQRNRAQCTFIGDQIVSSTPGLNMISQQLGSINKILSDPVAFGATLTQRFLCPVAQESFLYFMCETGSTYNKYVEYYQDFQQLRKIADYMKVFKKGPSDVCEEAMSATSDDSIYWERQNQPAVLTARQAAEQAGLSGVETLGGDDETPSEDESDTSNEGQTGQNGPSEESTNDNGCYTGAFGKDCTKAVFGAGSTTTGSFEDDPEPGSSAESPGGGTVDLTIPTPENEEDISIQFSPSGDVDDVSLDSEQSDGQDVLGSDVPDNIGSWDLSYTAGASAVLKNSEGWSLNADGELSIPTDSITPAQQNKIQDALDLEDEELQGKLKVDATDEDRDLSFGGADVTDLANKIEEANDRKFKNRLNRRAGPPVDLEEAAAIRDELSTASPAALGQADALRDVAEEMQYDTPLGEQNIKIDVQGEEGEIPAKEYLERQGLDGGQIEELTKKEVRRTIEKQLNKSIGDITAARYNATPGQMSAWNAGETGRMILQLRAAGVSGWSNWNKAGLEELQTVTNTVDDFANPQRAMCGQNDFMTAYGEASTDTAITSINGTPDIGALVGGSKAEFTTPTGNTNTSYVIGYKAITSKEGLSFNIILQGDQGRKDVTEQLAGSSPITVPKQDDNYYKVATRGDFTLAKSYDKVCMRFNQNPDQYFLRTTFNRNTLCQGLRQ